MADDTRALRAGSSGTAGSSARAGDGTSGAARLVRAAKMVFDRGRLVVPDRAGGAFEPALLMAHAKLTLSLRVLGRRADGYHLLESEMVTLDLADVLQVEVGRGLAIVNELPDGRDLGDLPTDSKNLVGRALALAGREAAVRLVKRIPVGAGLGGGSADAAAILRWAGYGDLAVAARLGSDVPFCITGGRAQVGGAGELVEPLDFEDRSFVLLMPPFAMDTAAVFGQWDRMNGQSPPAAGGELAGEGARAADPAGGELAGEGGNDLERAAIALAPQLAHWRDCLADATGARPRLAGSGSTWFIEGELEKMGLAGREYLVMRGERAPLVQVRTFRPEEPLAGG